eukprot:6344280-Prymnesium_polylepis.1
MESGSAPLVRSAPITRGVSSSRSIHVRVDGVAALQHAVELVQVLVGFALLGLDDDAPAGGLA